MATPDWVRKELRENRARASRSGKRAGPKASSVRYLPRASALEISLTNGAELSVPVQLIPGLKHASARDIRAVEILGRGGGLHWERLDLDLSVPALISSVLQGPTWMAELGRMGGRRSSEAKAAAARRNGRRGGRPRTSQTART